MENYLGQLTLTAFTFAPRGWALCNGQLLPINQNQPLFALLGVTYGGDGRNTFGLPNLQGRTPLSSGPDFPLGSMAGTEYVSLLPTQIAPHTHTLSVSNVSGGTLTTLLNNTVGTVSNSYASSAGAIMAPVGITTAGSSQPHENRSPYLVMNWIIALTGIFPSRG